MNSTIRIKQIRPDIGTGVIEYRVIDADGEIRWDGDVVGLDLTVPASVSLAAMLIACQADAVSKGHWVP